MNAHCKKKTVPVSESLSFCPFTPDDVDVEISCSLIMGDFRTMTAGVHHSKIDQLEPTYVILMLLA
jgi:hypothetical protein